MMGTDRDTEQRTTETTEEEQRAPADAQASGWSTAISAERGAPVEAEATAQRLVEAEAEIARLKDEYLRALAETENVRRRAARDREEANQYAISSFARDLLSVADNLQRALGSVAEDARKQDPALDALMSGVELTEKELRTVLDRHGVKRILATGQPFDPHVHEALYEIPDATVPHGTVLQEVQPGYTIHDRTLRPARVGIARGGPKPGSMPAADTEASRAEPDAEETVIEFPKRSAGDLYRKPVDDGETAGTRVDETH
jgi:molecular chaperone GrpE